jgi:hypothetical protein
MFCFCLMSAVHAQTIVLDISKSKLPQGVFIRKGFSPYKWRYSI